MQTGWHVVIGCGILDGHGFSGILFGNGTGDGIGAPVMDLFAGKRLLAKDGCKYIRISMNMAPF